MDIKQQIYNSQLSKYCRLKDNEKIFVIDEKIIRSEALYHKSWWGAKNKDRIAKATLMYWERAIRNFKHKLNRDITTEDVVELKIAMESYQDIVGRISGGWGLKITQIKKIDILEQLISETDNVLFEEIELKKRGFIREIYGEYILAQEHVVTVVESDEYFTIKEIYIPYSGIVIQLPTEEN